MLETLDKFCHWLQATDLSQAIQNIDWIVPTVQTIHILAIAAVLSSAFMINFRLLGILGRDQSSVAIATSFLPVLWRTLIVLLLSGLVLIIGEPARALENPVFVLKMLLLAATLIMTGIYQIPTGKRPDFWELSTIRRVGVKFLATLSLLFWVGIVFSGRWIAYVQAG